MKQVFFRLSYFFLVILLIFIASTSIVPAFSEKKIHQKQFTRYLDHLFADWVSADSITLHYQLSNPRKYGILHENISLENRYFSKASDYQKELDKLHRYQPALLSKSQKKIYHILEDYLTRQKKLADFPLYETSLSPTIGVQAQLPITLCEFPIHSKKDLDIYFQLLDKLPEYFEMLYQTELEKAEQGLFCSDDSLQAILKQMDDFCAESKNNLLITSFANHIKELDLNKEKKAFYFKKNKALILNTVLPAYQTLRTQLASLKGRGKNELGLCYFPKGKEYYTALTAYLTGSDASPKELIERSDRNIASLFRELEEILYLHPDAYQDFLNTDLADYTKHSASKILKGLRESIQNDFPAISNSRYTLKYVPQDLEKHVSPAFYLMPPIDNYSNNTIYMNKKSLPSLALSYSVLAHEGYPGHLYQTNYFYSHMEHPILSLCNYEGYVEGWAVYAENLSYAFLNFKKNKKLLIRLYQMNHILNLAIPARIDLGVHYEGWDETSTKKYLESLGFEPSVLSRDLFQTVISEPGNYLSYYIGFLEISLLNKAYQNSTKKPNKLKAFHEYFLQKGPCDFGYFQ